MANRLITWWRSWSLPSIVNWERILTFVALVLPLFSTIKTTCGFPVKAFVPACGRKTRSAGRLANENILFCFSSCICVVRQSRHVTNTRSPVKTAIHSEASNPAKVSIVIDNYLIFFTFTHLAFAAFFAARTRSFFGSAFARATPPFDAPNAPSATAAGFRVSGCSGGSAVWPVASATIWKARCAGSRGRFFGIFMQPITCKRGQALL